MLKFSLLFAFSLLLTTRSTTAQPAKPLVLPPKALSSTGEYPNLLAEWGLSAAEIQARIESTFQQLFYGNDATERIYYPVEPNIAYIEDINNQDIRSEGMSYGMMIAVQLDKQAEFNRLWTWTRTYMYHEAGAWAGYFCWHARTDGSCIDPKPGLGWRNLVCHSLVLRRGALGQRRRHLQLSGRSQFDFADDAHGGYPAGDHPLQPRQPARRVCAAKRRRQPFHQSFISSAALL